MASQPVPALPDAGSIEFLYAMSGAPYWEDSFLDGVTVEIWAPGTLGDADTWSVFVRDDRTWPGIDALHEREWQRLHAWHAQQLEARCTTLRAVAEEAANHLARLAGRG